MPTESVAGQILLETGLVRDVIVAEIAGPPCVGHADGLKVMPRLKQSHEYAQQIAAALGDPVADSERLLARA